MIKTEIKDSEEGVPEKEKDSIFSFLETLETSPVYRGIFYSFLEHKSLILLPKSVMLNQAIDLCSKFFDPENIDESLKKIQDDINTFCKDNFIKNGHHPTSDEIKLIVQEKISSMLNVPLDEIISQETPSKSKSNKEIGICTFISLCKESRSITSSVDMYTNYKKWCLSNSYGIYSSPTLTKYLRDSDKRAREVLSDKGRSQGWYLISS
jgi:hypothetical protein